MGTSRCPGEPNRVSIASPSGIHVQMRGPRGFFGFDPLNRRRDAMGCRASCAYPCCSLRAQELVSWRLETAMAEPWPLRESERREGKEEGTRSQPEHGHSAHGVRKAASALGRPPHAGTSEPSRKCCADQHIACVVVPPPIMRDKIGYHVPIKLSHASL